MTSIEDRLTVVGCLLVQNQLTASDAIALTRASRHGTIENSLQDRYVKTWHRAQAVAS